MERKKERLLEALRKTRGDISSACKAIGLSRQTFYNWREKDEEFAEAYEEINDAGLDFAESVLFDCMEMAKPKELVDEEGNIKKDKEGKPKMVLPSFKDAQVGLEAAKFYLERKGKERGYNLRTEVEDVTERQRNKAAALFPDNEELEKQLKEHEKKKKINQASAQDYEAGPEEN